MKCIWWHPRDGALDDRQQYAGEGILVTVATQVVRFAMYTSYIMQNSQTLERTQIYLTQTQQSRLAEACRRASVTKSELIRQAVDQFLSQQALPSLADKAQHIEGLAGLWADRDDMADPAAYVRSVRAPRF
jgi:hypothetical protein